MSGKVIHHDACGVGLLADLTGSASHAIVRMALEALGAMAHRGARAADGKTGDGAGVMLEIPRSLLLRELASRSLRSGEQELAIVGLFLPEDPRRATAMRAAVEGAARFAGVQPLFWRTPPADVAVLGPYALQTRPLYEQLIVDAGGTGRAERMRRVDAKVERALASFDDVHACLISASATSVVYKALIWADELKHYYADLNDPDYASRFALFHQRYSTNTAPSWRLVQPFRHVAHNGEINTIAGNRAWLRARGTHVRPGMSDSHDFDVALETLLDAGYAIDDAVDLLLGAAIDDRDERLRAYYDVHLPTIEHWDGPAAVTFHHADVVGAALDRSGFRPLRWCRTQSGKVLAASEAGILNFGDDPIVKRGRLGLGERLIVRLQHGQLIEPEAFRNERRERGDYRATVRAWSFRMRDAAADAQPASPGDLRRFAYTREDEKDLVAAMASGAGEPVWSMGDDAALPFLMRRQPVSDYLRQRFAQVTNPPIDSQRESLVFDMRAYVGCGGIHGEVPSPLRTVSLEHAIVNEPSFDALCSDARLQCYEIALVLGNETLAQRLDAIAGEAIAAVRDGASLIVLDNRGPGPALPGLLAAGCIHQRLTNAGLRMQASIVVADGYVRDAHSAAAIISAGANLVSPWLALRLARTSGSEDALLSAMRSGLMKVMAKLGICTLRSYVGAQTFETLGLAREIVEHCFPEMTAHLPSIGFAQLDEDIREWYAQAHLCAQTSLPDRGFFRYRREGVRHAFDPQAIKTLRASALRGDADAFLQLSDSMDRRPPVTVRDLLDIAPAGPPVPVERTEPLEAITRRFTSAAMSIGALSPEAHETVARAANRVGAAANSGEGGEDASRYPRTSAARSAIKQVASARFGVGVTYLASADEIEIKIAQGSKPGEGGQIPAHKVTPEIAKLRGATPGQALISPAPHHDIYSIEDLAQLIFDLRRAAPHARIAVKLVAQSGIGQVAVGVAKAGADVIHISGHDGGTGASPLGSIKHAGLPWELGLTEVHDALTINGLRARIRLRVDGGFKTGRDVIVAALLGADQFGFGSALLVALGCIYARQCHKNTCPVGIATQDGELRRKFNGTPEHGENFFVFVARDVKRWLARMGVHTLQQIRGRRDLLSARLFDDPVIPGVDLGALTAAAGAQLVPAAPRSPDRPHIDDIVDLPWGTHKRYNALTEPLTITPGDRAVGARIAAQYARRRSRCRTCLTLPVTIRYRGTAGQSFGAFLTDGIMLLLEGDANDYVGKSMEGGQIVVLGPGLPQEPAIGNACFYGARGGEAYIRGSAVERFGVRNSGATLVVEGAADHACEYMTAGVAVILGPTGRNVASGMSGGTVFVLSDDGHALQLGPADVTVMRCRDDDPEIGTLHAAIRKHAKLTASHTARELLEDWPKQCGRFVKIVPASHVHEGAVCHVTH
ncbi:MAG: glutamate synthase large subunit [Vulcanimicrobiaceae bacterium]